MGFLKIKSFPLQLVKMDLYSVGIGWAQSNQQPYYKNGHFHACRKVFMGGQKQRRDVLLLQVKKHEMSRARKWSRTSFLFPALKHFENLAMTNHSRETLGELKCRTSLTAGRKRNLLCRPHSLAPNNREAAGWGCGGQLMCKARQGG